MRQMMLVAILVAACGDNGHSGGGGLPPNVGGSMQPVAVPYGATPRG